MRLVELVPAVQELLVVLVSDLHIEIKNIYCSHTVDMYGFEVLEYIGHVTLEQC